MNRASDSDCIFLENISIQSLIGVYDWERLAPQKLELQLRIGFPERAPDHDAFHSDCLADTIDYAQVVERLRATSLEQHFLLLEALAEHIANTVLQEFGAPWVDVKLAKLGIIPGVHRVGVAIFRQRA